MLKFAVDPVTSVEAQQQNELMEANFRVGYIVGEFPALSETFVTDEIIALRALGWPVMVFSLAKAPPPTYHKEVEQLIAETVYWPPSVHQSVLHAHLQLMLKWPERYIQTVIVAVRLAKCQISELARNLFSFWQAGYFAWIATLNHVEHFHCHFAGRKALVAMFASLLNDKSYSFIAHAGDAHISDIALEEKMRRALFVATSSKSVREALLERCPDVNPTKVVVRYNGIDLKRFAYVQRTRVRGEIPRLLAVGRFVEYKGFEYLIEACSILKQAGVDLQCTIVGDGPMRQKLKKLVRIYGLEESVELPGVLQRDNLRKMLKKAHIFVQPSIVANDGNRDGIPTVLIEAMATGLPVISTTVSGIPELVTSGWEGLLVAEKDAVALADAMRILIEDPNLCAGMGKRARKKVEVLFDLSASVRKLIELWETFANL